MDDKLLNRSEETKGTGASASLIRHGHILQCVPAWVWLAVLLAGIYAFRHYPTFTERALLWDDFLFFTETATMPRFYQTLLYTFLHFTPFLRLSVFGMFHLVPLPLLPAATSAWNVFWVVCLAISFFRLVRVYGISPVAGLLGITFILFNPLFTEVQIWYIETFNLVALVFIVEGLVQLEKAVATDRPLHWVAAALLSILASCAWSSGYYVGLFYVAVAYYEKARLVRPWKALTVLAIAFLTYPALKTLGMHLCGGTIQDVTPWTLGKLLKALSYIVGHGLFFGSLGLWGTPHDPINVPKPLWIPATIFLTAAIVALGLKKEWRKHAVISLIAIYVGLAVPVYFRGTQFSYDDYRWFVRYFTKPVFGMGLFLSIVAHLALQRFRHAWLGVSAILLLMAVVLFVNKMPEHYVGAGTPVAQEFRFRKHQVQQLGFLEELFATARYLGVGSQPFLNEYFIPIGGCSANINNVGLYKGSSEPNMTPLTPEQRRALDRVIKRSGIWESYQNFSHLFIVPEPLLEAKAEEGDVRVDLLAESPSHVSKDILIPTVPTFGKGMKEMSIMGKGPSITFKIPESIQGVCRLFIEAEVAGVPKVHVRVTLVSDDPGVRSPSLSLTGASTRQVFDVPLSRMPWFPTVKYKEIRVEPNGVGSAGQTLTFRLWRLEIVSSLPEE